MPDSPPETCAAATGRSRRPIPDDDAALSERRRFWCACGSLMAFFAGIAGLVLLGIDDFSRGEMRGHHGIVNGLARDFLGWMTVLSFAMILLSPATFLISLAMWLKAIRRRRFCQEVLGDGRGNPIKAR